MKKIKRLLFIMILYFLVFPFKTFALTEAEARKLITDYAYFVYNNKRNEIAYTQPSNVKFDKVTSGYYTSSGKYDLDCDAFVSFIVYNALQANSISDVFDTGRVALNGPDGWCSHSKYYDETSYSLNRGEYLFSASKRYNMVTKLQPGDLIGVIGYSNSTYATYNSGKDCKDDNNQAVCGKGSHIMLYVGNGNYIHNSGSGVIMSTLPEISHGNKVGAYFNGGTHGSITAMRLKNYNLIPSSVLNKFRYPNGQGGYNYYDRNGLIDLDSNPDDPSSSNSNTSSSSQSVVEITHQYREEVIKIIYIAGIVLLLIRIIVPIILIVYVMINLIKAFNSNDSEIKLVIRTTILKVIAAIIVFFIFPIANLVIKLTSQDEFFKMYMNCLVKPSSCNVSLWNSSPNNNDTPENSGSLVSGEEVRLTKSGTYIVLSTSSSVSGYYFSKSKTNVTGSESGWISSNKNNIDFVLLPGNYYIYTKLSSGKIVENDVSISPNDIVDTKKLGLQDLNVPFDTFLKSKNTSIEEFNNMIYRSVSIAGYNTREGVAAAALSISQSLYHRWKIKIPWGCNNYAKAGANPKWGGAAAQGCVDKGYPYIGIHCGGFVVWSFTNANYSMNDGIGSSKQIFCWGFGKPQRETASYYGSVGDVVTVLDTSLVSVSCGEGGKGGHVGVITYKTANGFWVTESDTVGIVTTFENASNTRWRTILDMSITYNKNLNSNLKKGF